MELKACYGLNALTPCHLHPSPNSYVETLNLHVMVLAGGVFGR